MIEKYYVAGCVDNGLGVDQVEDQDAEFWTLYARDGSGESEALADFADRRSAEAAMAVNVEREALNEQVRALAAENLSSRNSVQAFCDVVQSNTEAISEEIGADGVRIILAAMSATGNMPATDAILSEVRAQGVDGFAAELYRVANEHVENGRSKKDVVNCRAAAKAAEDYAARIRAWEVPDV